MLTSLSGNIDVDIDGNKIKLKDLTKIGPDTPVMTKTGEIVTLEKYILDTCHVYPEVTKESKSKTKKVKGEKSNES